MRTPIPNAKLAWLPALIALVGAAGGTAHGAAIASVPFTEEAILELDPLAPPRLQLRGLPGDAGPPFDGQEILFDVDLESAAPGSLFQVDATSPAFAGFAERLTNGVDDLLWSIVPGEILVPLTTESFFLGSALEPGDVDFAGFTIERIELRIDGVQIIDNPPNPPPLVFPTDGVIVDATLHFEGAPIPEPSSAVLFALGFALLARRSALRSRSGPPS